MTQATNANPDTTLVIERLIDAPPDVVFHAFTDPASLEKWWGPHGYATRHWTIDLRVGGAYRYEMYVVESGEGHWCSGIYSVVEPGVRLTSTANIEWDPESDIPELDEMIIDILFLPEGHKTRVIATQSGLPDATWADNATEGWSQQFEKLGAWLQHRQ